MEGSNCFQINHPRMIHETVDGETLVIDSETGVYFALPDSASVILRLLTAGCSVDDVLCKVSALYRTDREGIRDGVEGFITGLLREEIIIPNLEGKPVEGSNCEPAYEDIPDSFQQPVLQKFDDLQQLMLLDPIHDVDDRGWPFRK